MQVQNVLYRLSMANLCQHSQVLADMFNVGRGSAASKGKSDDNLIEIPELLPSTFDLFIKHHFGL